MKARAERIFPLALQFLPSNVVFIHFMRVTTGPSMASSKQQIGQLSTLR